VAFGTALTKFDLFMRVVASGHHAAARAGTTMDLGLAFVGMGIVLLATSFRRFRTVQSAIMDTVLRDGRGDGMERTLTAALVGSCAVVLVVLIRAAT
jgi:uncharacterized membrane protein YidH (DUF202 family)